jgi:hypothetical protein
MEIGYLEQKLLGSNVSACRQTTDPQQITTAEFACRQ